MWNFLKSDTPDSSLRVNMFMASIAVSFILFNIGVIMLAYAFIPTEVTYNPKLNHLVYVFRSVDFIQIGTGVGLILAGLFSLWYGKKLNKNAENETPKAGDPAQPNPNPQNLQQ